MKKDGYEQKSHCLWKQLLILLVFLVISCEVLRREQIRNWLQLSLKSELWGREPEICLSISAWEAFLCL